VILFVASCARAALTYVARVKNPFDRI
jgi:hypothetical protein